MPLGTIAPGDCAFIGLARLFPGAARGPSRTITILSATLGLPPILLLHLACHFALGLTLRLTLIASGIRRRAGLLDRDLPELQRRDAGIGLQGPASFIEAARGFVRFSRQPDVHGICALKHVDFKTAEMRRIEREAAVSAALGQAGNLSRKPVNPLARDAHVDDFSTKGGGSGRRCRPGGTTTGDGGGFGRHADRQIDHEALGCIGCSRRCRLAGGGALRGERFGKVDTICRGFIFRAGW